MAGGKHAEFVPCLVCLGDMGLVSKAARVYEGDENDEYECEKNKHRFYMDWSSGEAEQRLWPPPDDMSAFANRKRDRIKEKKKAKAQGA